MNSTYSPSVMAHVAKAIEHIGSIKPWHSQDYDGWVFEHPDYPESCFDPIQEEVIEKYPFYLANLFQALEDNRISPETRAAIKGRGGHRPGAGRKKGSLRARPNKQMRVPVELQDVVRWLREDPRRAETIRLQMAG